MAISGLREVAGPAPVFETDNVGVMVEVLDTLGLVNDRDQLHDSINAEYTALMAKTEAVDLSGELYVDVPYDLISTNGLIAAIDSRFADTHPQTYVYNELWTPGKTEGSYSDEQLANSSSTRPIARLALYTAETPEEPLLHFRNQPFDDYTKEKWGGDETQLQAIASAKESLQAVNPELAMSALGHRAVALIAMQRRIKGEAMPMSWGFMRDGNLPRTTVDGYSVVGFVHSYDSQLRLIYSYGDADPDDGVGLSVGLKAAA